MSDEWDHLMSQNVTSSGPNSAIATPPVRAPCRVFPMLRHMINPGLALRLLQPPDAKTLFGLIDSNRAHLRIWLP